MCWRAILVRSRASRTTSATRRGATGFDLHLFGAALTVGIALITQMGEQADYLRFMPERTAANRGALVGRRAGGGPGWVVLGVLKMLGGALLAYLAISHMVPAERAVDPNQMYLAAYEYVFPQLRLGGRGHGAVRRDLAAQDQRHQRLCRLAGLVATSSRASRTATRGAWCGWCSTR